MKDSKDYYLNLRAAERDGRITKISNVERADRFIYINRGDNGLWRVNSIGQNNVPYGQHGKLIQFILLRKSGNKLLDQLMKKFGFVNKRRLYQNNFNELALYLIEIGGLVCNN